MKIDRALAATSSILAFNSNRIESWSNFKVNTDNNPLIWPWRSYKTTHLTPPHVNITHSDAKLADGYLFVAPVDVTKNNMGLHNSSGMGFVVDMDGDLVYAAEEDGFGFCNAWVAGITDFRTQVFNNRSYITYWNGCNEKDVHWGYRWGRLTFIDDEYVRHEFNPDLRINTMDRATHGSIDMHEHQMTDRNTLIVTSYNVTQFDLSGLNGPADAWLADGLFFELDVLTGEVLFEWHALDHLELNQSHIDLSDRAAGSSMSDPLDWMHLNSVQAVGSNYLISARHHSAVYLISGQDGSIILQLGGRGGGTWNMVPPLFKWQHHARATNVTDEGMTVSILNNHININEPKTRDKESQGLAFWIPMPPDPKHIPVLTKKLQSEPEPVFTVTQGSYQLDIGGGHGFIGYGAIPKAREYGPDGDVLWQADFGHENAVMSYRAFKQKWHGTPRTWNPVALLEDTGTQTSRAYVSWNGATDITAWAVYAGNNEEDMKLVGIAEKLGFETAFEMPTIFNCIKLAALQGDEAIQYSNLACSDRRRLESSDFQPSNISNVDKAVDGSSRPDKDAVAKDHRLLAYTSKIIKPATWDMYKFVVHILGAFIVIVVGVWIWALGCIIMSRYTLRIRSFTPG